VSFHRIKGLKWARPCERPRGLPFSRARGAKRAGLAYEKKLAEGLFQAKHGQWFEYEDVEGRGFCQTDVLLQRPWGILILEAKYTWTPVGHAQLEQLYLPVVAQAWGLPTRGLVVCKIVLPETPRGEIYSDLDSATAAACLGRRPVLHWLGANLGPLQTKASPSHLACREAAA
jgi:hypothetical protein